MSLLEQWGVPLSVLGMLSVALLMAALIGRHQVQRVGTRAAVRRLEAGVSVIADALGVLGSVPLSKELRITLRSDILERYRRIRRLYPAYPAIGKQIRSAEMAFDAERTPAPGGVGRIDSEQALATITAAIERLIAVLQHGETLVPVPGDVRAIFCRELAERRAEATSRFLLVAAKRHQANGDTFKARGCLTRLMRRLRQGGLSTDFVRALYREAEAALSALQDGQLLLRAGRNPAAGDRRGLERRRKRAVGIGST